MLWNYVNQWKQLPSFKTLMSLPNWSEMYSEVVLTKTLLHFCFSDAGIFRFGCDVDYRLVFAQLCIFVDIMHYFGPNCGRSWWWAHSVFEWRVSRSTSVSLRQQLHQRGQLSSDLFRSSTFWYVFHYNVDDVGVGREAVGGEVTLDFEIWYFPINVLVVTCFALSFESVK